MKCKDCKFWIKEIPNFGKCSNEKFMDVSDFGDMISNIVPVDGIAYRDYESYKAHLWTGAEFGCIHFQEKL